VDAFDDSAHQSPRELFGVGELRGGSGLWRFADLREYTVVPLDDERARRASLSAVALTDLGENQPILAALRPVVDELDAHIPQAIRRRHDSENRSTSSKLPLISGWVEKVKKLAPLR